MEAVGERWPQLEDHPAWKELLEAIGAEDARVPQVGALIAEDAPDGMRSEDVQVDREGTGHHGRSDQ